IGSAYTIMNSKALGADMVFALEGAQVGPMKPELAAQIVAADGDKTAKADAEAVIKAQISAEAAARRGYVDNIISADAARKNLVYAFEMLYLKEEGRPDKKHGTI
ncbi:MAG: carboxyl transferase, partial [Lachnospiraceae bacterium]|nr:carboxyl transferase [Lachnospiraceae bacterium]